MFINIFRTEITRWYFRQNYFKLSVEERRDSKVNISLREKRPNRKMLRVRSPLFWHKFGSNRTIRPALRSRGEGGVFSRKLHKAHWPGGNNSYRLSTAAWIYLLGPLEQKRRKQSGGAGTHWQPLFLAEVLRRCGLIAISWSAATQVRWDREPETTERERGPIRGTR